MEASVAPAALKEVLIVLGAAGVVIPLFHRLRISPVLGFMLVGAGRRAVRAGTPAMAPGRHHR